MLEKLDDEKIERVRKQKEIQDQAQKQKEIFDQTFSSTFEDPTYNVPNAIRAHMGFFKDFKDNEDAYRSSDVGDELIQFGYWVRYARPNTSIERKALMERTIALGDDTEPSMILFKKWWDEIPQEIKEHTIGMLHEKAGHIRLGTESLQEDIGEEHFNWSLKEVCLERDEVESAVEVLFYLKQSQSVNPRDVREYLKLGDIVGKNLVQQLLENPTTNIGFRNDILSLAGNERFPDVNDLTKPWWTRFATYELGDGCVRPGYIASAEKLSAGSNLSQVGDNREGK